MGFGDKRLIWLEESVFKSYMSILVNGSPTKDFLVQKGLRQGDPLSSFLFVLAMEGLTSLVRKSVELGDFKPFKFGEGEVVDILQFTDDTILLREPSIDNLWCLKVVLRGFELVSGLRINFMKSNFMALMLGGLDIRDVGEINKALLLKWKWRILTDDKSIWSSFLKERYVEPKLKVQGLVVEGPKSKYYMWWRDVIANDVKTEASDEGFMSNTRLDDCYCWQPTVFMGSTAFEAVAASSTVFANHWKQFLVLLDTVRPSDSLEDRFEWMPNPRGTFSVASISTLCSLAKQCAWEPLTVRILKILWRMDLSLRIIIVATRFFTSRLPTIDSLIVRGVANIPNLCCVFCGVHPESLLHVFFSCQVSMNVWERVYTWLGEEVPFTLQEFKEFLVVQEKLVS
ncbi:uncharacterized protein LOC131627286 [Vicia villosa]|uniref:uncharacterized protein LOC131627286 n=1 Tax=Vicia villosa TaxID=3911 RepID=UPI00273A9374|nr:uncharacterized protein LOC131627286 [Vicia villosa]